METSGVIPPDDKMLVVGWVALMMATTSAGEVSMAGRVSCSGTEMPVAIVEVQHQTARGT